MQIGKIGFNPEAFAGMTEKEFRAANAHMGPDIDEVWKAIKKAQPKKKRKPAPPAGDDK